MNLTLLPLSEIKPYENNPRRVEKALPALKASIERFGYNVPIVVDAHHVIISGHARYAALKELGYTEASVIVSDMPEDKAREWRLLDNRSSEQAEWDRDKLVAELRTLEEPMDAFFDSSELKRLVGSLDEIGRREITEEQVAKAQASLETHFTDKQTARVARTIMVKCKCCGQEFGFDKPSFQP